MGKVWALLDGQMKEPWKNLEPLKCSRGTPRLNTETGKAHRTAKPSTKLNAAGIET